MKLLTLLGLTLLVYGCQYRYAYVKVTSTPPGASISLDDKDSGNITPAVLEVMVHDDNWEYKPYHKIVLKKEGLPDKKIEIGISARCLKQSYDKFWITSEEGYELWPRYDNNYSDGPHYSRPLRLMEYSRSLKLQEYYPDKGIYIEEIIIDMEK